ncbi:MAG: hypothetical protein ABFD75_12410 [Smithella sp.]
METTLQNSGTQQKNSTLAELLTAFEDMLKLFSPFAAAFPNGKGLEICTRAETALAKTKGENI